MTTLGQKLYEYHIFMAEYMDIQENCFVYRTYTGPIIGVFAKKEIAKEVIDNPFKLVLLKITHDLRHPVPSELFNNIILNELKEVFGEDYTNIYREIKEAGEKLATIQIDEDHIIKRSKTLKHNPDTEMLLEAIGIQKEKSNE